MGGKETSFSICNLGGSNFALYKHIIKRCGKDSKKIFR